MSTLWFLACALATASLAGCIPSNVVAPADRAVRDDPASVVWRAGRAADLHGYFSSRTLDGEIAASVRKLHYWFEPDGTFTGAALLSGPPLAFAVLSGAWTIDAEGRLLLGADAEPTRFEAEGDLLRWSGADGMVVLEREELR